MRIAHRWRTAIAALWIAWTAALASAAPTPSIRIEAGAARGAQGARAALSVHLRTDTDIVATENVLTLPPPLRVHWDGGPACAGGPDRPGASFAFHPEGCAPGRDCTGVRARVMDLGPVVPIPDGALLYTCTVDVGDTPPGVYPIDIENPSAVDPNGVELPVDGQAGAVTVEEGFATRLEAATISGLSGTRHRFDVALRTDVEVAGTGNSLTFSPLTPIAARANGRPECELGDDVPRPYGTSFAFTPTDCQPGVTCTGIRALVLTLESVRAIPDGTVLYSCELDIATDARPGTYALTVSEVEASNPHGGRVLAGGSDGAVIVEAPTPTPTSTPRPPTTTPSATATTPPTRRHDGDGCATVPPRGAAGWLLPPLLLALSLIRQRRVQAVARAQCSCSASSAAIASACVRCTVPCGWCGGA